MILKLGIVKITDSSIGVVSGSGSAVFGKDTLHSAAYNEQGANVFYQYNEGDFFPISFCLMPNQYEIVEEFVSSKRAKIAEDKVNEVVSDYRKLRNEMGSIKPEKSNAEEPEKSNAEDEKAFKKVIHILTRE